VKTRAFTLVSTLITILLILGLAVFFMAGTGQMKGRKDGLGKTIPGRARARALDTECTSHLSQIRQGIQIYTTMGEDPNPDSLKALRLGSEFEACPIGKEPYEYDSATGKVKCVHEGHEEY